MQILLVEDLLPNQQLATTILRQAGHIVTIANHGGEALALIEVQQQSFDLVLMDLQMPTMNGFEATERIRCCTPSATFNPDIPIIAVTANALVTEEQKCKAIGMNGYLRKPYRPHELIQVIEPFTKPRKCRDKTVVLKPVEADAETLSRLKSVFITEAPHIIESLYDALAKQNATHALQMADKLKMASDDIGASRIATQSIRFRGSLEMGDWEDAQEMLTTLARQIEQAIPSLS